MAIDKINYKGTEFDILPPVEIISKDDFFTNVNDNVRQKPLYFHKKYKFITFIIQKSLKMCEHL